MFVNTPHYKFLDVMNYVSLGTSHDKWVQTYGATQTKSWLLYEWFDSANKLDHKGLPPYPCWYSKLKKQLCFIPSRVQRLSVHLPTFRDWLEYYNNLDVSPFLEALETMKAFYTNLGIDIFKDAVSLPGISMQYILHGTLKRQAPPRTLRSKR